MKNKNKIIPLFLLIFTILSTNIILAETIVKVGDNGTAGTESGKRISIHKGYASFQAGNKVFLDNSLTPKTKVGRFAYSRVKGYHEFSIVDYDDWVTEYLTYHALNGNITDKDNLYSKKWVSQLTHSTLSTQNGIPTFYFRDGDRKDVTWFNGKGEINDKDFNDELVESFENLDRELRGGLSSGSGKNVFIYFYKEDEECVPTKDNCYCNEPCSPPNGSKIDPPGEDDNNDPCSEATSSITCGGSNVCKYTLKDTLTEDVKLVGPYSYYIELEPMKSSDLVGFNKLTQEQKNEWNQTHIKQGVHSKKEGTKIVYGPFLTPFGKLLEENKSKLESFHSGQKDGVGNSSKYKTFWDSFEEEAKKAIALGIPKDDIEVAYENIKGIARGGVFTFTEYYYEARIKTTHHQDRYDERKCVDDNNCSASNEKYFNLFGMKFAFRGFDSLKEALEYRNKKNLVASSILISTGSHGGWNFDNINPSWGKDKKPSKPKKPKNPTSPSTPSEPSCTSKWVLKIKEGEPLILNGKYTDGVKIEIDSGDRSDSDTKKKVNISYEILNVRCNKEGFDRVVNKAGAAKITGPGLPFNSSNNGSAFAISPILKNKKSNAFSSLSEVRNVDFFYFGKSCQNSFECTIEKNTKVANNIKNDSKNNVANTGKTQDGTYGAQTETGLSSKSFTFFRDNSYKLIRNDVSYLRNKISGGEWVFNQGEPALETFFVLDPNGTPPDKISKSKSGSKLKNLFKFSIGGYNSHSDSDIDGENLKHDNGRLIMDQENKTYWKATWAGEASKPHRMKVRYSYRPITKSFVPYKLNRDGIQPSNSTSSPNFSSFESDVNMYCDVLPSTLISIPESHHAPVSDDINKEFKKYKNFDNSDNNKSFEVNFVKTSNE